MTTIERSEAFYAREIMGEAGALFPVHYPAAEHYCLRREDTHIPTIESGCLLYTSPSPRDATLSRMPSSA